MTGLPSLEQLREITRAGVHLDRETAEALIDELETLRERQRQEQLAGLMLSAPQRSHAVGDGELRHEAEGLAKAEAERHLPDMERGGCTCGFCAYSIEHVVVMSVRVASAALVGRVERAEADNEKLQRRLFPAQGESYANEVERQRYVIEKLTAIIEAAKSETIRANRERDEAQAALRGSEDAVRTVLATVLAFMNTAPPQYHRAESRVRSLLETLNARAEVFDGDTDNRSVIDYSSGGRRAVEAVNGVPTGSSSAHCEQCHRPLPHTEPELAACPVPTDTDEPTWGYDSERGDDGERPVAVPPTPQDSLDA